MGRRFPQLGFDPTQQPLGGEPIALPQAISHHRYACAPDGLLAGFDIDVAAPQRGLEDGIEQIRFAQHHGVATPVQMSPIYTKNALATCPGPAQRPNLG